MPVWQFRDQQLNLNGRTGIMGILNITPDSFSDGGRFTDPSVAVERALEMERQGAVIIDIGGQSTRPGHIPVPAQEEWERIAPLLSALQGRLTIPISVDSYYPYVAERALESGAAIINDVSNSLSNGMAALCSRYNAGLVMMHHLPEKNTPSDVMTYFDKALVLAEEQGLSAERVCLDIGIGFGKSREEDAALIRALPAITKAFPDQPVLVGASRKRVVAALCGDLPSNDRLPGTLAIHTVAQMGGANLLRVHDVKEAVQAAALVDKLQSEESIYG